MKSVTFAILCLSLVAACQAKLHITILYESLCPDSKNFLTRQLEPNFNSIEQYVDILLVPFGKASSNGQGGFNCHHGPAECKGNILQSCAINEISNDAERQVKFVACQMGFLVDATGKTCASKTNLSFENIDRCMNNELGYGLQLAAEEVTKIYKPSFVPTIIYNHVFNQSDQNRSLYEFKRVVCEKIGFKALGC